MSSLDADVLVVGGGPTGLALAGELLRHGITVTVIEARGERDLHSKAISISASSLQVFDHMGVIDDFLARGARVPDILVHVERKRFLRVDYGNLGRVGSVPYPFLLSLPQPAAEAILENHLIRRGGSLRRGVRLTGLRDTGERVEAELECPDGGQQRARFRYVVGCDGSRSTVRQLLGIATEGSIYDLSFIHGDFTVRWDGPRDTVHYFVTPRRFGLIIPMSDGKHRVVVQVPGSDPAALYPAPTIAQFEELLEETGVSGLRLSDPAWVSHARLFHVLAEHYRSGRVFLAGDACHLFSPIGGQGMNTGIQDAFNLAWKLACVLRGDARADLLDSYEPERKPIAAALLASGDASTQLLLGRTEGRPDLKQLCADLSPRLANRHRLHGHFPFVFSGVAQSYPASRMFCDDLGAAGDGSRPPRAGDRAPDAVLGGSTGRMFGLFRSERHLVLVFVPPARDVQAQNQLAAVLDEIDARYGHLADVAVVGAADAAGMPRSVRRIDDSNGDVARCYGASPGAMFVVRPDRYIEASGTLVRAGRLFDHLDQLYVPVAAQRWSASL